MTKMNVYAELSREQFAVVFGDDLDADIRNRTYTWVTNFARFSAVEKGVGLYVGRLIRECIR